MKLYTYGGMHIPTNEIMYICRYDSKKYMYGYGYTQLCGGWVYTYYWNYVTYTGIYISSDLFYESISVIYGGNKCWFFHYGFLITFLFYDVTCMHGTVKKLKPAKLTSN